MTRIFCLSKEAYMELIRNECLQIPFDENFADLEGWIQQSKTYFDIKIVGLNYFLCRNLELLMDRGLASDALIARLYSLQDEMLFVIEEFNVDFVERLILNTQVQEDASLEDDLYDIANSVHYA